MAKDIPRDEEVKDTKNMKALILAAGEGKRMQPLTFKAPKPLLKINRRPILDYIFDSFPADITEVVIVVKYLGDMIKTKLGSKYRGRKIYFAEGSDKGTAYSFLSARPLIKKNERFLFVYGDEIPHPRDVKNCMKKELSVLVFESRKPKAHGIVILKKNGSILEVIEKPDKPKSNLAIDGAMVLNDRIFNYRPLPNSKGEYHFTSLLNQFCKDYDVWPVEALDFIGDITTPQDIERVSERLRQ